MTKDISKKSFSEFLKENTKEERIINEETRDELEALAKEYKPKFKTKYLPIDFNRYGDLTIADGIKIKDLPNISFSYHKRDGFEYSMGSKPNLNVELLSSVLLEVVKNKGLIEEYIIKREKIIDG